MTEDDIHYICKQYKIENYTINHDMTIDVNGNVNFAHARIKKLPLKFGKVFGDFDCFNSGLTTLEGCPSYVGGNFKCYGCDLTSLCGCPKTVVGLFWCFVNNITSLERGPRHIGGNFDCSYNPITRKQTISNISVGSVMTTPTDCFWRF